jgi:hypothetical protein
VTHHLTKSIEGRVYLKKLRQEFPSLYGFSVFIMLPIILVPNQVSDIGVYEFLSNENRSSINVFITTMNSRVAEASTCTVK